MAQVIINMCNKDRSFGLTYVALSRVKRLKDIMIKPFDL